VISAIEIFFITTVSSSTANTFSLPSSLQTLTPYSAKLWEHMFQVSSSMTSMLEASEYPDGHRSISIDSGVERTRP